MMKSLLLKCIFLLSFSSLYSYEFELAICAIFQDDAKYIPEWIEFHQKQGVERFYLYNNLSTDNYLDYLSPYIESGVVELTDWSLAYANENDWYKVQCEAYMNCIRKIQNKVRWCAFLDTDEFLFNPNFKDLKEVLVDYDEYPGVTAHWIMYGTSGVQFIPEGEKMLDHLVWRQKFGSRLCKSIVKPELVTHCRNPHFFIFKDKILAVNENKTLIRNRKYFIMPYSASILRINHYWSRDLDFFTRVKIPRRSRWNCDYTYLINYEALMNDVFDPILRGF